MRYISCLMLVLLCACADTPVSPTPQPEVPAPSVPPEVPKPPAPEPPPTFTGTWQGTGTVIGCHDDGVFKGFCANADVVGKADSFTLILAQAGTQVDGNVNWAGVQASLTGTADGIRIVSTL
jgi:hypothetical protein